MERAAIVHSPDRRFCYALDAGRFLIRIRAKAGDLRRLTLHTQDKYIPRTRLDTHGEQAMELAASDGVWDCFETVLSMDMVCLRYFFQLEDTQGDCCYYGNFQFYDTEPGDIEQMFDCPQNLREEARFCLPRWAANRVVYQVFPSRFASDRPVPEEHWYQAPIGHGADLGGNLRGITEKLPHLQELGVEVLYMTPIFRSDSSHKYDTIDYFQIDPAFGTEDDLRKLVDTAHALGLRVVLDAVFNHTARDFFAFRDIREKGQESEYLDWYYIRSFPLRADFGQKPSYKTFSYYGGMPKLNLKNPRVAEYFLGVARYWMRACHIDGWRLDVADEVSHDFWRDFRRVVKEENPEALIIGESWHQTPDFLDGDQWDTMMNYDFRTAALGFAARGTLTPSRFLQRMGLLRGSMHREVYPCLWNLVGSHDTRRVLDACGGSKARLRLTAAVQLLWPGMPMICYGDEVGLSGGPDPDCRRGMLWKEERQDRALFSWYQTLIRLRKTCPAITRGRVTGVQTDDSRGILALTRTWEGQSVTLVFYNGSRPAPLDGVRGRDLLTGEVFGGTLEPFQALVLQAEQTL